MLARGSRRGIGTGFVAVAIVISLITAISAYFLLFYGSGPSPIAPPGQTSAITLTIPQSAPETISPATQTTIAPQLSSLTLINNLGGIFGNFSQMTVNSRLNGTTETVNYIVLGRPIINSTQYWEVNFTLSKLVGSSYLNSSAIIWFGATGNPTIASIGAMNYTGKQADVQSMNFTAPLVLSIFYSSYFIKNQVLLSQFQYLGQETTDFGPISMTVESYSGTFSNPISVNPDDSVSVAVFRIGTYSSAGGESVSMVTYFALKTQQGESFANVISITG